MSDAPANIPPRWLLCKEGRKFEAAVANLTGSGTLHVERVVEKEDGSSESGEWYVWPTLRPILTLHPVFGSP